MITTDNTQTLVNALAEIERLRAENEKLRSLRHEREDVISGLRDEIELLNSTLEGRNRNIETLYEVSTARRKVLEQAFYVLEQANHWFTWLHGDDKTLDAPLSTDVANAIKEILK